MNSPASNGAVPRVLVADDSDTIQKVVRIALARHPVKIETASNWQEASAKLGEGIALLMLDVNLPGVGSDPSRVREVVTAASGLPVVVMQGTHDRSLGESTLRECGVNHIIQKPFDSSELIATVTRLTGVSQKAAESLSAPPPPPPATDPLTGGTGFTFDGLPPLPAVNPLSNDLVDSSRKGKKAFELDAPPPPAISPEDLFRMVPPPPAPSAPPVQAASVQAAPPLGSGPVAMPPLAGDEMAQQIRKAVEAYCDKHFRSLAIEVISAELRRLAEEKARHLVDI